MNEWFHSDESKIECPIVISTSHTISHVTYCEIESLPDIETATNHTTKNTVWQVLWDSIYMNITVLTASKRISTKLFKNVTVNLCGNLNSDFLRAL